MATERHKVEISDFPDEAEHGIVRGLCSCGMEFTVIRKEKETLDQAVRRCETLSLREDAHRHRPSDWRFN